MPLPAEFRLTGLLKYLAFLQRRYNLVQTISIPKRLNNVSKPVYGLLKFIFTLT